MAKRQCLAARKDQRTVIALDSAAPSFARLECEIDQDVRTRRRAVAAANLKNARVLRDGQHYFASGKDRMPQLYDRMHRSPYPGDQAPCFSGVPTPSRCIGPSPALTRRR